MQPSKQVDLILISSTGLKIKWDSGQCYPTTPDIENISGCIRNALLTSKCEFFLIWDSILGPPRKDVIEGLVQRDGDVFHAGLLLDTRGQPTSINYISPTWMLNLDPDPNIEATSWRISLRACLIRTEVLRQMGGPLVCFESIEAAGLEMGYRYIRNGVFICHTPKLLISGTIQNISPISIEDQMRFIASCYGRKWLYWSGIRAVLSGHASLPKILRGKKKARQALGQQKTQPFINHQEKRNQNPQSAKVSVLIPTVNRYPYLRTLLNQLRNQTINPIEIIIVDQTPLLTRDKTIQSDFSDLPIKWFWLDHAGQCSSRNLGLSHATGDYILFLDDDDEIPNNLIESHMTNIRKFECNISNGSAIEPGFEDMPKSLTHKRISDVFPTNNTMIRKDILSRSGLFDLAYDHGQRADHDLGTRIYLTGEKMVLDPSISVLHHHAPQGGLREHKARVITRAASRRSIWLKVLPSVSDIYLAKRYFTKDQVREMLWISVLSSFTMEGSKWQKSAKSIISLITLPHTLLKLKDNVKKAEAMLAEFPQIPSLENDKR